MDGVGEGVNDRERAKPPGKRGDGIHGAGGIEQQQIEHAEHGARGKRVLDADHEQKHHAVEGDGGAENQDKKLEQHPGMKDDAQSCHERADDGEADAGESGLDGAGHVQAED